MYINIILCNFNLLLHPVYLYCGHYIACTLCVPARGVSQQEVNVTSSHGDQTFVSARLRPAVCPNLHLNLTLPQTTRLHFLGPELAAEELQH